MSEWTPENGTILGPDMNRKYLVYRDGKMTVATKEDLRQGLRHAADYGPRSLTEFKLLKEAADG